MSGVVTPTGRLLGAWPSGSPEWHEARRSRLGGSDMAAVLGRSPWVSPYRLWHLKNGAVIDGPTTDAQARGHYLEDGIRRWWADRHPEFEVAVGGTYTHVERDYQLANPDGLLVQDGKPVGVLEVKTDSQDDTAWGQPGTDEIPLYYRTQVMWYLDVLGLEVAHVAVLTARLEFREYVVHYDETDAAILRARAEMFLDSLLFGEVPDIDSTDSTYQTIRDLHPEIEDREVELSLDEAAAFARARDNKKAADAEWTRVRSEMADRMGTAKRAVFLGQRIAARQAKNGTPFVVADRKCPPHTDFIAEEFAA
ncbi:hypothetical protein GCM10027294_43480 [Marinactinospora endophytica]